MEEVRRSGEGGTDYDLLAIGSGGAAFAAPIRATKLRARVALLERDRVGGPA